MSLFNTKISQTSFYQTAETRSRAGLGFDHPYLYIAQVVRNDIRDTPATKLPMNEHFCNIYFAVFQASSLIRQSKTVQFWMYRKLCNFNFYLKGYSIKKLVYSEVMKVKLLAYSHDLL